MASSSSTILNNNSNDGSLKFDDFKASIDMNCSICFEVFTDPLLLKCGHTFCKICTERLIMSARETAQQQYHYGTPTMACPECRAEMPADRSILVKNYRLADIINKFNSLETDSKDGTLRRNNNESSSSSPTRPPTGIMCSNCKELCETRHLFYCSWCSSGRSDPLFACGTCCVHHHGQHQLTSYSQMSTIEERQAFVFDSIVKLNNVSINTYSKLNENRITNEYDNCKTMVQESFIHLEPVLNNFETNSKLTKQQLEELNENIETYLRLCQDTANQMQKIQMKHGIEWNSIRDTFSSKTSNIFSKFSQSGGAPIISMPPSSTNSTTNEFTFPSSSSSGRHRASRRLVMARRRLNNINNGPLNQQQQQQPSSSSSSNNHSHSQIRYSAPDNSDDDL